MWRSSSRSSHVLRLTTVKPTNAVARSWWPVNPFRGLATVLGSEDKKLTDVWFTPAFPKPSVKSATVKSSDDRPLSPLEGPQPASGPAGKGPPQDERTLKLGKSMCFAS